MNMIRKEQMRGAEKGDSMGRSPLLSVCLEWLPKLNKQRELVPLALLQELLQHNQKALIARRCCHRSCNSFPHPVYYNRGYKER